MELPPDQRGLPLPLPPGMPGIVKFEHGEMDNSHEYETKPQISDYQLQQQQQQQLHTSTVNLQPEVEINHGQNTNNDDDIGTNNSKSMNENQNNIGTSSENMGGERENMGDGDGGNMSEEIEDMGVFEDVINAKPSQSTVWKNFFLNRATGATKCKHCSKIMTRNTTSMRRHLKSLHDIDDGLLPEHDKARMRSSGGGSGQQNFVIPKVEHDSESPWYIESLYELIYFHCPQEGCDFVTNNKQKFIYHACESHPESMDYLKNIRDGSTDDILCPWNYMGGRGGGSSSRYNDDSYYGSNEDVKYEGDDFDPDDYGIVERKPRISEYDQLEPEVLINQNDDDDDMDDNYDPKAYLNEDIGEFVEVTVDKPSRASVWKNFLLNKATGAGKCKHCGKIMTRNTTSMRRHLKSFHGIEDEVISKTNTSTDGENNSMKTESQDNSEYDVNTPFPKLENPIDRPPKIKGQRRIKNEKDWASPVWKHFIFIRETKMCKCNHCPKMMARSTSSMRRHLKSFHDIEDNIPQGPRPAGIKYTHDQRIKCDKCDKMVNDLDKHNAARHEKCFCDRCGNEYPNRFRLKRHINEIHNKIPRPAEDCECKICHKTFVKRRSLKMHMKSVHEKIKDQLCTLCGVGFSRNEVLKLHIKTVHEGRKDQICKHCGKAFSRPSSLNIHVETVHKGIKRWKCEICDHAYGQSHELKKHLWSVHKKHMYGPN